MDIVNSILVKNKKEQTKTVALSMGTGDQTITPDAGKVLSSVTVEKPATLVPSNIKNGVNIGGVVGDFSVPLEAQKTVALDMASGDQTITPTSGNDGMEEVVVQKPATLLPENIKDGVTIGGVTGNYTAPTPTLITKQITANGTYTASSDNADGFSEVTVNVPATPAAPIAEKDVNFYDYDGTVVAAYTAADFANLAAMPSNPTHTGLTAQGWNWTLADAKTYVASYGKLNIGQMYATASGKTEYDVEINEATGMTATLGLSGTEKDWGDGTIDTNTSHTYATAGNYTIKLSGTTLSTVSGSKKVQEVRIANGVTIINNNIFSHCRALQSVTIPSSVTSIRDGAFSRCYALQCITLPDGITTGLDYTNIFSNNGSLNLILFSKSIESFGKPAFAAASALYSLKHLTLPSNLLTIGNNAFIDSQSLQSVTIPNSVTSIGDEAFRRCYSLRSVTIPSSVTSINDRAFYECDWLTIMTVLATTPPTLVSINSISSSVTKIYIPNGTLATYQGASNWSNFSSLFVELPA